jgi:uncharacterized protein YdcH (DUF465 family)
MLSAEATMTTTDGVPSLWTEIKRTRDELRLNLHLAGLEARDRWAKLEPKVDELERKVNAAGDAAGHGVGAALETLAKALLRLRDDIVPTPTPTTPPSAPEAPPRETSK